MSVQRMVEYDCFYCDACRDYVYDESVGDPDRGIPAHTSADMLPPTWHCPKCGARREQLRIASIFDDYLDPKPGTERIDSRYRSNVSQLTATTD